MRREIRVFAGAGKDDVSEKDGTLVVRVRAPAQDNRANVAVLKVLRKHFGKDVRMISGHKSKRKIVET